MSELTKEHFEETLDKKLKGLATTADLQTAVAPLATKQDVREGVEELARITSGGFAHAEERFDDIETRFSCPLFLCFAVLPSPRTSSGGGCPATA